ncbi:cell division ATP-binding protein FtsE [Candidatus Woesebacteria bacterium]|nr:cell division ATP-binding protein FtsE [Candidatus Woesebacteria bacterium]
MVKFAHVSKSFGDIKALQDVSFTIEKGEFVFITGPSGAGKTTILKLILREILPDSGQIVFDGQDILNLPQEKVPYLRQKIGVVFQDYKLLPERTLRENVEVPLAVTGINQHEWDARVNQVLKLVGLAARSELFPAQLSGGELQRVSLARALVINPKLLLADEPTGNLDWETADAIMELFEKINKEGKTVLMATHNKHVVEKLKKRVIHINEGKLVGHEKKSK